MSSLILTASVTAAGGAAGGVSGFLSSAKTAIERTAMSTKCESFNGLPFVCRFSPVRAVVLKSFVAAGSDARSSLACTSASISSSERDSNLISFGRRHRGFRSCRARPTRTDGTFAIREARLNTRTGAEKVCSSASPVVEPFLQFRRKGFVSLQLHRDPRICPVKYLA